MQYLLMDYVQEEGWHELTRDRQEYWLGAYRAYMEAMTASGVLKSSNGLHSASAATTVRIVNDKAQVLMDNSQPAGNLFASGEIMSGNILGKGYLAGFGMTIGTVFGRIAGQEAARRARN